MPSSCCTPHTPHTSVACHTSPNSARSALEASRMLIFRHVYSRHDTQACARALDERDQQVESRACNAVEAAESFDDHDFGLPDDLYRRDEQSGNENRDNDQGNHGDKPEEGDRLGGAAGSPRQKTGDRRQKTGDLEVKSPVFGSRVRPDLLP